MVRLFHVYYPVRTLVLLVSEAILVGASFLVATVLVLGRGSYLALSYEGGAFKIATITLLTLLCSYYLDLYAPQLMPSPSEIYFRLITVVGILSILIAAIAYFFPTFKIGPNVFLFGLIIVTCLLIVWRGLYAWIIARPQLRERIYVLGSGDRARYVVDKIRSRSDLGLEIVEWSDALVDGATREDFVAALADCANRVPRVDRIIIALQNRRGTMPTRELLDLKLAGIKIEDITTLLEKLSGKIELEGLHPSALIFTDGFAIKPSVMATRRCFSLLISATALLLLLPILPLVALAVRLSSSGPVLFSQKRVGYRGKEFTIYKFRTMRQDAESKSGAVWATKDDPRATKVGRLLRKTRLDEIPQLWNVVKGDMGFVGPRPERPEFVQWLTEQIPYYNLRHSIRPGMTGWAQVRYQYGASLEETKQKLEYDLYYIKHISLTLDFLIVFETIKTALFRRGGQ